MIIGIASADYLRPDRSPDGKCKWGGAGWARIGQYLPYLRAAGHTVVLGTLWRSEGDLVVQDDDTEEHFTPDITILQRLMHEGIAKDCRDSIANGQIIINDIDDWYWGLDTRNAAWKASHPKHNELENTSFYGANIAASSLVTVSTPYIADMVSNRWNVPVELLPNTVDVSRFTPVNQVDVEVPVLGWAGSTQHRSGDLEQIRGVLHPFAERGDYTVYHGGHADGAPTFADRTGLPLESVICAPLVMSDDYPKLLTMNVGIVPLRDVGFNHAKSAIKGLEYAASGIPFIASPSSSYVKLHGDFDGHFRLAKRPKDWIKGLKYYTDPGARQEDSAAILDLVKSMDISYGAKNLLDVLEGLVK